MSDTAYEIEDPPGCCEIASADDAPLSESESALMRDLGATGTTRRDFLKALTASGISLAVAQSFVGSPASAQDASTRAADDASASGGEKIPVTLNVNGKAHSLNLDSRVSLLDALREHLHLTGSKKGCDQGQCGACTVISDGRRILSCLSLAVMHQHDQITTIEGLGTPDHLHPMQAAFVKHDGYQCGYCTPGQICSAVAVLDEVKAGIPSHATVDLTVRPELSNAELRERMSGNICRCGAYSNIVDAITEVAERNA